MRWILLSCCVRFLEAGSSPVESEFEDALLSLSQSATEWQLINNGNVTNKPSLLATNRSSLRLLSEAFNAGLCHEESHRVGMPSIAHPSLILTIWLVIFGHSWSYRGHDTQSCVQSVVELVPSSSCLFRELVYILWKRVCMFVVHIGMAVAPGKSKILLLTFAY